MRKDELLSYISENTDFKIEGKGTFVFIREGTFTFINAFYIDDKKHPDEKRKLMISPQYVE